MQQARCHRGMQLRPSLAPGGQANWFRRWNEKWWKFFWNPWSNFFPLPCFFFFLHHASLFSLFVLAEVWGNLRTVCRPSVWRCLSIFTWLSQWPFGARDDSCPQTVCCKEDRMAVYPKRSRTMAWKWTAQKGLVSPLQATRSIRVRRFLTPPDTHVQSQHSVGGSRPAESLISKG